MTEATKHPREALPSGARPLTALLLIGIGRECERRVRGALAHRGLKPQQVYILDVLSQQGPIGQRELGEMLDVDHSLLVTQLNPLEADGLIERVRNDEDRRRHHVLITAAGQKVLDEALSTIESVQTELLQPLGEGAGKDLERLLQTVRSGFVRGFAPTPYGHSTDCVSTDA